MKILKPEFIEFIPESLSEGVLYISMIYGTAVHRCCCGCGSEVVTPLSPTDWQLKYDGESVSLTPSIGNWSFPCQSHYWIRKNKIEWSKEWSNKRIKAGRQHDRKEKRRHFNNKEQNSQKKVGSGKKRWWLIRFFSR